MSWLRDRVETGEAKAARVEAYDDPWVPAILARVPPEVLRRLTYAVLDERDADDLSFVLTPWPHLDALGRVRHRRDDAVEVCVDAPAWAALLAERRIPEVLRERPQRIGDAFAVLLTSADQPDLLAPAGPVVDITADARDAARAAFYGAVASPLPDDAESAPHARHRVASVDLPDEWGEPVPAS
jgi:hypothetical protein